jgi:hypothetical protein
MSRALKYHGTHHKIHFWGPWAHQLKLFLSEVASHRCVRETLPLNRHCSLCLDVLTAYVYWRQCFRVSLNFMLM